MAAAALCTALKTCSYETSVRITRQLLSHFEAGHKEARPCTSHKDELLLQVVVAGVHRAGDLDKEASLAFQSIFIKTLHASRDSKLRQTALSILRDTLLGDLNPNWTIFAPQRERTKAPTGGVDTAETGGIFSVFLVAVVRGEVHETCLKILGTLPVSSEVSKQEGSMEDFVALFHIWGVCFSLLDIVLFLLLGSDDNGGVWHGLSYPIILAIRDNVKGVFEDCFELLAACSSMLLDQNETNPSPGEGTHTHREDVRKMLETALACVAHWATEDDGVAEALEQRRDLIHRIGFHML
jgi:hypothetical protein